MHRLDSARRRPARPHRCRPPRLRTARQPSPPATPPRSRARGRSRRHRTSPVARANQRSRPRHRQDRWSRCAPPPVWSRCASAPRGRSRSRCGGRPYRRRARRANPRPGRSDDRPLPRASASSASTVAARVGSAPSRSARTTCSTWRNAIADSTIARSPRRATAPAHTRSSASLTASRPERSGGSTTDTGSTSTGRPARARWAWSSEMIRRHAGWKSILVTTSTTTGHAEHAALRNSSSGMLSSCAASDTNNTASAAGSAATVAALCTDARPPTPGVSTSWIPPASRGDGTPSSTSCSPRWLPGLPASVHICARSPYTIDVTTGSDPTPSPGEVTVASSWSAQRTSVGTAVARSSSTGQTSNPSRAFTSALLPILNSPAMTMRTAGSLSRPFVSASRDARSGRWRACMTPITSSSSAC